MTKRPLFELPCPSTSTVAGPTFSDDLASFRLSMEDDDGRVRHVAVRFTKVRAMRRRAEIYCKAWHIQDAYDTVCEIEGSDWVAELRADSVPEWRDFWTLRHFILYLDSFGCLEVIAESATLEELTGSTS